MPFALETALAVFAALEVFLVVFACSHAVMWRREPRAAGLWIAISLLVPLVGPLMYFVFGINRTQRRARRKLAARRISREPLACDPAARAPLVGDLEPLAKLIDRVTPEPLVAGNRIEPLWDGEEAFPAMREAIAAATKTIGLCSYIFDDDATGVAFADDLAAAAGRGVKVKLLVDAMGAGVRFSRIRRLCDRRRLSVSTFDPIGFSPSRLLRFNLRNHRKILVVDGRVGFSGGINISSRHTSGGSSSSGWCHDVHFRMRGPVVAQLCRAFADDWAFAAGENLAGEDWFPKLEAVGATAARGIPSGPDQDLENIYWAVAGAVSAAKTSIRIVTPYFIPEQGLRHAIIGASLRGVDVTLQLPVETDNLVVAWATRSYLWELLQAGVKIVYSPPPFDHSKLVIVDGRWVMFGSANLDPRSLRLNFEYNVEAFDRELCEVLLKKYDERAGKGTKVTLKDVDGRSTMVRLRDGVAKLFSPYL